MSSQGWISVHRQIQNCFLWKDKPFAKGQAWIDLLLLANHKNDKISYKGKIITCERGTVNRSISELADRWGWDRKKVRRFLALLESDNMVSVYSTTHRTTITLINYDDYQVYSPTNDQQMTDQCPTSVQPVPTYNNDNNVNNENNNINLQQVVDLYDRICVSLPKVQKLSDTRKRTIKARLKKYSLDDFKKVFELAEESDFLTGRSKTWKANFDWLINETNMIKVLEGNYANKTPTQSSNDLISDLWGQMNDTE